MRKGTCDLSQKIDSWYKPNVARNILRRVLIGLSILHQANIMHGDLRPSSFFHFLGDGVFDQWDEVLHRRPMHVNTSTAKLKRKDKKEDLWAPEHVHRKRDLTEFARDAIDTGRVKLADLSHGM